MQIKRSSLYLLFCLQLLVFSASYGQKAAPPPQTTRILFILDASGSMFDLMEGRTRMQVAKEILTELVDSLRSQQNLELALRVYGHQFDKKYNNCNDTKLEVGFSKENHDAIIKKIKVIDPKGTTLIANSLLFAADDFPEDKNSRNVILLITDGIEACGGDPCAISLALQKKRIFLKPFIIGLGANASFEREFSCMGQYFDASDINTFKKVLKKIMEQTLSETTVRVNLLDVNNEPKETNVNMSFVNAVTGETIYDFVHYIKPDGKSDNLTIDPILSYDIVVNTIPKVIKKNVYLEGGKENIINIKTPQGSLNFRGNYKQYKQLEALIQVSGSPGIINVQNADLKQNYLVGIYDVEILTLPRIVFKNIRINQSKTTTLDIESPGVLSIVENIAGYGSLYQILPSGEHQWIYDLDNETSKSSLAMQPGNYKFVFRSKNSTGSKYTDVQFFTIRSGMTTTLKLFR